MKAPVKGDPVTLWNPDTGCIAIGIAESVVEWLDAVWGAIKSPHGLFVGKVVEG